MGLLGFGGWFKWLDRCFVCCGVVVGFMVGFCVWLLDLCLLGCSVVVVVLFKFLAIAFDARVASLVYLF